MKYRIKERIDGNNISTFIMQEKILWWWIDSWTGRSKEDAQKLIKFLQTKEVKYHTVEQ